MPGIIEKFREGAAYGGGMPPGHGRDEGEVPAMPLSNEPTRGTCCPPPVKQVHHMPETCLQHFETTQNIAAKIHYKNSAAYHIILYRALHALVPKKFQEI